MVKENSVLININSIDKLKEFANVVVTFESDINIYREKDFYDAKSIVAIMALDMSKPRYIEINAINSEELERFKTVMKAFEVEN